MNEQPSAALAALREAIRAAAAGKRALRLRGAGSKDFYGETATGDVLDCRPYAGIVDYEPTELVVTARCGTPLAELEALLESHGQWLAFEPPRFGSGNAGATVGGMVAAGLSGPGRMAAGAVRDFVLGARLLDGHGRDLALGGRVMKNVAGYDVSRLLAGSLGILGLIAEVSLKTLPRPVEEVTLRLAMSQAAAIEAVNRWSARLPVSASAWLEGLLSVRLSGASAAVRAARETIGGEALAEARAWWEGLRNQSHPFFAARTLWRLSLPATTSMDALAGLPPVGLVEWNGAQRWIAGNVEASAIRAAVGRVGGHATLFRSAQDDPARHAGVFQPLTPVIERLHRSLKREFDPAGILNPGRLVRGL